MKQLSAFAPALATMTFLLAVLPGCAPRTPYRVYPPLANVDCTANEKGEVPQDCRSSVLERARDYDLLFVEFDDQGLQYPAERVGDTAAFQINGALEHLKQLAEREAGLSLVVFVHGWNHDASHDDGNLKAFRTMLASLAAVERSRAPDEGAGYRVVGLYVSWRGRSSHWTILQRLSFWTRKSAATHIAMGSSRELFARLRSLKCALVRTPVQGRACEDAPGTRPRMRLVLIGHSFGGLILYNALSGTLIESLAPVYESGPPSTVPRQVDLIVLLNPAFEATRYTSLHRIATLRDYAPGYQPPLLVSVTATGDSATRVYFPLGRRLNSLFQRPASPEENLANRHTIGHMRAYTTHELGKAPSSPAECDGWLDPADVPLPQRQATIRSNREIERRNARVFLLDQGRDGGPKPFWTRAFCGGAVLSHVQHDPRSPVWNVRADPWIMKDHDDIANPRLGHFLRQLYHDTVLLP